MNNITPANLGWWIVAFLVTGSILSRLSDWSRDRWEIGRGVRARFRPARRWYGTHAHVCLRAEAEADDPELYVVLGWDPEHASVPSLKVHKLNPEYLTRRDEDAEAFWAPVTCFAPYTVRRFRPHMTRFGRVCVPWLTKYLPLPGLGIPDGRAPEEINTAYYLNTAAWNRPYDPPGTAAASMREWL